LHAVAADLVGFVYGSNESEIRLVTGAAGIDTDDV
jgi:hypothetical protein